MKDTQLTLRLPHDLDRAVARAARERGVPKSQLVREALQAYLATPDAAAPGSAWARVASLVGGVSLDPDAVTGDPYTAQLRAHNWRE